MAEKLPHSGDSRPRPASPSRQGSGAETGWAVTGTLISGMVVWGGAGWLLDRWLGILFFAPAGILLGTAVAIYMVVARYGAVDPPGVDGQAGRRADAPTHTAALPGRRRDNGDLQRLRARQRARCRSGLRSPRPRGVLPP